MEGNQTELSFFKSNSNDVGEIFSRLAGYGASSWTAISTHLGNVAYKKAGDEEEWTVHSRILEIWYMADLPG